MNAETDAIRCPGCGHSCCPNKRGWAALECGGDSDTVRACERDLPPAYAPGDPGEPSERCEPTHVHGARCSQDEIGDWWHTIPPKGQR